MALRRSTRRRSPAGVPAAIREGAISWRELRERGFADYVEVLGGGHAILAVQFYSLDILGVRSDPEPNEPIGRFDRQSPIIQTHTDRPQPADLF